jgi:haloalkane dehalogenase
MHYIDEGKGETILFVHGTPSWSFDFRNVILDLRKDYRCIAMDHIGFGLSDKPADYDYSTAQHSSNLSEFIAALKLESYHLLVHDFGGPIALKHAIDHPQEINSQIILNSWLWSSRDNPEFRKLETVLKSPLLAFLYLNLNFSARFLLPRSLGRKKLTRKIHRHYRRPFASRKERFGTLGFARSLLNDQDWFEQIWNLRTAIADKPTLFVWGLKDPFLGAAYLQKFQGAFHHQKSLILKECGHFPQEEEPYQLIESIRNFLS